MGLLVCPSFSNDYYSMFLEQVLALPLPHRPLFPGFYMPIYVKV